MPRVLEGHQSSQFLKRRFWPVSGLPLALIGNASGQTFALRWISLRGVFDKEVRRKPLAFAADAWGYGI
jgi:hypothetical protein